MNQKRKKPRFYLMQYRFCDSTFPYHIKYGISVNVKKRIGQIQTPDRPIRVWAWNMDTVYKSRILEKYFSVFFSRFKRNYEWLVIKDEKEHETFSKQLQNFIDFLEDFLNIEANYII